MKNRILYFIVIAGALLLSCKKQIAPGYPIAADLKAAFSFKPGSYWIYKDSATNVIDSFFVTGNLDVQPLGTAYETISIPISEYNVYPGTLDSQKWVFTCSQKEIGLIFYTANITYGYIRFTPLINYPYATTVATNGTDPTFPDTASVSAINTSCTVAGQSFSNVAIVNHRGGVNPNGGLPDPYSFNDWFYIAPGTGLIKIVQYQPQDNINRTWELQRSHVVF
jgi:hypothetical protein